MISTIMMKIQCLDHQIQITVMERNVLGRLQQKLEMVFVAWGLHSIQVLEVFECWMEMLQIRLREVH